MDQEEIDNLLKDYLGLLDQYEQLRQKLSDSQSSVFAHIARANFSGERGMRYGKDSFDQRMQAIRRLNIEMDSESKPRFCVSTKETTETQQEKDEQASGDTKGKHEKAKESSSKENTTTRPADPLRWFGLFAPTPLRFAQGLSIQTVHDIIPQLATVDHEMRNLEIEIRRARKRRAKSAAAAIKQKLDSVDDERMTYEVPESQSTMT